MQGSQRDVSYMKKALTFLLSLTQFICSMSMSSSPPIPDFLNLLRLLLNCSKSSAIFIPMSRLFASAIFKSYATDPLIYQSHDVLHLCHKSEHRNIKHFIPAFSLNFFNVSASFICAWIWAFNSCIFFKFSTICRLKINNGNISIHN